MCVLPEYYKTHTWSKLQSPPVPSRKIVHLNFRVKHDGQNSEQTVRFSPRSLSPVQSAMGKWGQKTPISSSGPIRDADNVQVSSVPASQNLTPD